MLIRILQTPYTDMMGSVCVADTYYSIPWFRYGYGSTPDGNAADEDGAGSWVLLSGVKIIWGEDVGKFFNQLVARIEIIEC